MACGVEAAQANALGESEHGSLLLAHSRLRTQSIKLAYKRRTGAR